MQRKQLKVDWDELEEAFARQHDDVPCYLDRVTGRVVLEGEGEEDDPDLAPVGPPTDDAVRAFIHPPSTARKVAWMRVFLDTAKGLDASVIERLRVALDADDPAAEVGAVLREAPEERDAWFLYRSDRLHEMIVAWLEEKDIEPIAPPPWDG